MLTRFIRQRPKMMRPRLMRRLLCTGLGRIKLFDSIEEESAFAHSEVLYFLLSLLFLRLRRCLDDCFRSLRLSLKRVKKKMGISCCKTPYSIRYKLLHRTVTKQSTKHLLIFPFLLWVTGIPPIIEECLKWQMSLFPGGVFSVHEKYCFATVNPLCL